MSTWYANLMYLFRKVRHNMQSQPVQARIKVWYFIISVLENTLSSLSFVFNSWMARPYGNNTLLNNFC